MKREEVKPEIKSIEVSSIQDFESALQPYKAQQLSAERKLRVLQEGLRDYEKQKDNLQKKLNDAIRTSQENLLDHPQAGKTSLTDNDILKIKSEMDGLSLIIEDLQGNAIPAAQSTLNAVKKDLDSILKRLLKPLRESYADRMRECLVQAGEIADQHSRFIESVLKQYPQKSFEHQGLFVLISLKHISLLGNYLTNVLGLRV